MVEITNKALGPRVVWEKGPDDAIRQRVLQMGETADVVLAYPKDPVMAVWKEKGELAFGAQTAEPEDDDPAPPADADLDGLTDDELIAYITERGGKADKRMSRNTLLATAEKVKG